MEEKRLEMVLPKLAILASGSCFVITLLYGSFGREFDTALFIYSGSLSAMKSVLFGIMTLAFTILNYTKAYKSFDSVSYILVFGLINSIVICIAANNFLSLIVGLELYSFSTCFFLMTNPDDENARKTASRFILMSSVMTATLLFGTSLYYSQFGTMSFLKISLDSSLASVVGTVLVLCGLLFKLGIVPFHSWMIDVYESGRLAFVMFLETVWKFFMVFIFIKVFLVIITGESVHYQSVLAVLATASMLLGGLMPIFQANIKKFLAYASVGHLGFVLTVFAVTNNMLSTSMAMTYLTMYCLPTICLFSTLMIIGMKQPITRFKDLVGLIYKSPIMGFGVVLPMFAMIGLPPFPSFLAKLNMIKLLVSSQNYTLLAVSIIYSVLSLFYVTKCTRYLFRRTRSEMNVTIKSNSVILVQLVSMWATLFLYPSIERWFMLIVGGI
jgi:NADH-quinone oxidoreductase subunit N